MRNPTLSSVLWLAVTACGSEGDDSTDGDADSDADTDSDSDADGNADAGTPGPCGGTEALEVHATITADNPYLDDVDASGVEIALDCGATRLEATTGEDGRVVFEGLSLGETTVDLTAIREDTNALTLLGVGGPDEGGTAVEMALEPLSFRVGAIAGGSIVRSDPDSLVFVSLSNGAFGVFDEPYWRLGIYPLENNRLVAIEYLVDEAGDASPLTFFDASRADFVEDPFPDVVFTPGDPFSTATLTLTVEDPRLSDRGTPGDDRLFFSRAELWARVYDRDEEAHHYNATVGFTTRVESTATLDLATVAWWPTFAGTPRTSVTIASADHLVGSRTARDGTPDDLGDVTLPEPPDFEDLTPGEIAPLSTGEIVLVRPGWAEAMSVAISQDTGGAPLEEGFPADWLVVVRDGRDAIHLPAVPGNRDVAYVVGSAPLRLRVEARNGSTAREGTSMFAYDARYLAQVE